MNMPSVKNSEDKPIRNIALLNDTSAWYHWGCTCTSYGLRSGIGARGFDIDPISIVDIYDCQETPGKIADYNDENFFKRFCAANTPLMKRLAGADAIVVNGEGTLHGTGAAARNLLYLAYVAKTRLGRAVHIVNHSCYPEDSATLSNSPAKALYKLVYGAVDFIAVREPLSADVVKALEVPCVQAFDCMPLFIAGRRSAWAEGSGWGVVFSGSVAWRKDTIPLLAAQIEEFLQQDIAVSVLVGAAAKPASDDKKFVAALRDAVPHGWELVDALSEDAWLRTIAGAALLISGRFHHTIAAACLGTPSIAFGSNTPKMEGMLALLNQAPPLDQSAENLAAQLKERIAQILAAGANGDIGTGKAMCDKLCGLARRNFEGLDALAAEFPRERLGYQNAGAQKGADVPKEA